MIRILTQPNPARSVTRVTIRWLPLLLVGSLLGCTPLPYTVAKVDDAEPLPGVRRVTYHVVITKEQTVEQVRGIVQRVTDRAKHAHPFNSLTVLVYDYPEYVSRQASTLGRATYAPQGDFTRADEVKTGSYQTMEFKWELRTKDWSKRLTPDEVRVWLAWWTRANNEPDTAEDVITAAVAETFKLTAAQVKTVLEKEFRWEFGQ